MANIYELNTSQGHTPEADPNSESVKRKVINLSDVTFCRQYIAPGITLEQYNRQLAEQAGLVQQSIFILDPEEKTVQELIIERDHYLQTWDMEELFNWLSGWTP